MVKAMEETAEHVSSAETIEAKAARLERTVAMLRRRERMLAEENLRLAAGLKERGIAAPVGSHLTRDLPPPRTAPLEASAEEFGQLNDRERAFLNELLDGEAVYALVRTASLVDVGSWFRQGRVCAGATDKELILFAVGRRAYAERIPFRLLRESLYNHVMGHLALAPAAEVAVRSLRMAPADGYQMLAQIYKEKDHA